MPVSPGKVTDPDLYVGILQEAEDVLQQVLLLQVCLQLLHFCYVFLQPSENDSNDDRSSKAGCILAGRCCGLKGHRNCFILG